MREKRVEGSDGTARRTLHIVVCLFLLFVCAPSYGGEAGRVLIEAENADGMEFPFEIVRDEKASGGMKVGLPEGIGKPPEVSGAAKYRFKIEKEGNYVLWMRKWWADGCGNSFKISVDDADEAHRYLIGEDGTYEFWDWIRMSAPASLNFKAGDHILYVHNNEDDSWFDQILLVTDKEYIPRGQESAGGGPEEVEIYRADDFMREEDQLGAWRVASGTWKVNAVGDWNTVQIERSANAFQFRSVGNGERLCLTDASSWWRDYSVEVAAMSSHRADIGIVFLRSDESNYYLWRIPVAAGRMTRLVRMVDGVEEVLFGTPDRLEAGQWYLLRVTVQRGNIILEIDGNIIAHITDLAHLKGGAGLFAQGIGDVFFDDLVVRSVKFVTDDFSDRRLSGWLVTKDKFRPYTNLDRDLFRAVLGGLGVEESPPAGEGPMLAAVGRGAATTGNLNWDNYKFSFDVLPALPAAWSVVVGIRDNSEGTAFSFEPAPGGVRVRVDDMENSVEIPGEWLNVRHRVRIDNNRDTLTLSVDGKVILKDVFSDTSGRIGFKSTGGGILFDNVNVRIHERSAPGEMVVTKFADERSMKNWASNAYVWKDIDGKKRSLWNRLDFPGDIELVYSYGGDLPEGESLRLGISSEEGNEDAGCRVTVTSGGIELTAGKEKNISATLDSPRVESVTLRRSGNTIAAWVNGNDILKLSIGSAVRLDRVWAALSKSDVNPEKISVASDSTIDQVMGKAPVDWRVSNGEFGITHRWKCDPRWSWFSLMSPAEAVMWNKKSFKGDISVDMWASPKMELRGHPLYSDPGDLNLTICADGKSLGSGYSLIFGGYDNTATRLLRKDEIVAETTEYLAPSTRHRFPPMEGDQGLHRRWFHIAMKKRGGVVRCFLDEKMILEYEDPEPLEDGQVAAWTFDNGMMIARIRISAEEIGRTKSPLVSSLSGEPTAEGRPFSITSSTHPFRAFDFETGREGWGPRRNVDYFAFDWDPEAWDIKEDNTREVLVRLALREGEGRCLSVKNLSGGGTFGADVPLIGTDLMKMPILSFDYMIPSDVFINLYIKIEGEFYCVVMTGGADPAYGVSIIGSMDVTSDGKWRAAKINLRNLFLKHAPGAESIVIEDAFIGIMNNREYLVCGIGGNPAGSEYRIDNVRIFSPGPAKGEISWSSGEYKAYMTCMDRNPETVPEGPAEGKTSVSFEDLADGRWYLHIIPSDDSGSGPARHVALDVDTTAPAVLGSRPWDGGALRIRIDDGRGAGIDPASIVIEYGGRMYSLDHPALSYDPVDRVISLEPDPAGIHFEDGQKVTVTVVKLSDFLGNAINEPVECAWKIDLKNDFRPPSGVAVIPPAEYLVNDDFESPFGEKIGRWETAGGKHPPEIGRSAEDPALGKWSLQIQAPRVGSAFKCVAYKTPFDAGKFPVVSFDYKITEDVDIDIDCVVNGLKKHIHFADDNSGLVYTGSVPDVVKDGTWHHASFNLYEILLSDDPYARKYTVEEILFIDSGWKGSARGASVFIDNFRIEPVYKGTAKSLSWRWFAEDPSGISEVLYQVSGGEWNAASSPEWTLDDFTDGYYPIMVKAADSLGNWSAPAGGGIMADNTPPVFEEIFPGNGARAAANEIRLDVRDATAGIDKESIRFAVNDKTYTISDPQLAYHPGKGRLTFSGWADGRDIIFPDGEPIRTSVVLRDHAGNETEKTFTWTMDFAADTAAPPAPYVAPVVQNTIFKEDFEGSGEEWRRKLRPDKGARFERQAGDAATGRWCLAVFNTYRKSFRLNLKLPRGIKPSEYPMLIFDYRIRDGMRFNVYIKTEEGYENPSEPRHEEKYKDFFDIMFTVEHKKHGCTRLAKASPNAADGNWHRASFNLAELIKQNKGDPNAVIKKLYIGNITRDNPREGRLYLDNVCLAKPQKNAGDMTLAWTELTDATGIASYSYLLDQSPSTEELEEKDKTTAVSLSIPADGEWFFHVKGKDGAGNQTQTTHHKIR